MAVQYKPEGYHTATPYLMIRNAAKAVEFYKQAFDAEEILRIPDQSGKKIGHAEIKIGDSIIMLADEEQETDYLGPESIGGTPVSIILYVEDVDKQFEQAVAAGAEVKSPLRDQFYGDRSGSLKDPFGHNWSLATHIEDVDEETIQERLNKLYSEDS